MLETPWLGYFAAQGLYALLHGYDLTPDGNLIPFPESVIMIGRDRLPKEIYLPMNEPPGSCFAEEGIGTCPHYEQILFLAQNVLGIDEQDLRNAAAFCGAYVVKEDLSRYCLTNRVQLLDQNGVCGDRWQRGFLIERFLPVKACEVIWMILKWIARRDYAREKETVEALTPQSIGELVKGDPFNYQALTDFMQADRIVRLHERVDKNLAKLLQTLDGAGKGPFADYGEARKAFYLQHLLDSLQQQVVDRPPKCPRAPEALDSRCDRDPFFILRR